MNLGERVVSEHRTSPAGRVQRGHLSEVEVRILELRVSLAPHSALLGKVALLPRRRPEAGLRDRGVPGEIAKTKNTNRTWASGKTFQKRGKQNAVPRVKSCFAPVRRFVLTDAAWWSPSRTEATSFGFSFFGRGGLKSGGRMRRIASIAPGHLGARASRAWAWRKGVADERKDPVGEGVRWGRLAAEPCGYLNHRVRISASCGKKLRRREAAEGRGGAHAHRPRTATRLCGRQSSSCWRCSGSVSGGGTPHPAAAAAASLGAQTIEQEKKLAFERKIWGWGERCRQWKSGSKKKHKSANDASLWSRSSAQRLLVGSAAGCGPRHPSVGTPVPGVPPPPPPRGCLAAGRPVNQPGGGGPSVRSIL